MSRIENPIYYEQKLGFSCLLSLVIYLDTFVYLIIELLLKNNCNLEKTFDTKTYICRIDLKKSEST
jgi:hypothetical protein